MCWNNNNYIINLQSTSEILYLSRVAFIFLMCDLLLVPIMNSINLTALFGDA
jgi:hypothetical protein